LFSKKKINLFTTIFTPLLPEPHQYKRSRELKTPLRIKGEKMEREEG
jgi:hypothetical protein